MTQSTAPQLGTMPLDDVAAPMTTAPANAIAQPASSLRGKPSCSNSPASTAMMIGPVLVRSAAVPASTRRSAAFTTTLYKPNQSSPQSVIPGSARRGGSGSRRASISSPSAMLPTNRRPTASPPG
jgi:hypothetical protein